MKYMSVGMSYIHRQASGTGTVMAAEIMRNIAAVPAGNEDCNRVGRHIFVHGVEIRILYHREIHMDGVDTTPMQQTTGIYLILDKNANDLIVVPSALDIWGDPDFGTVGLGAGESITAFPNPRNEQRFEFLKELIIEDKAPPPWEGAGDTQDAEYQRYLRFYSPINRIFSFNDDGAFENTTNMLSIWAKFTRADVGDNSTTLTIQSRLCYDDSSTIQ